LRCGSNGSNGTTTALPEYLCSIPKAPGNAEIAAIPMPFQLPYPMVISTPSQYDPQTSYLYTLNII
jgi:hypothetical protein